MRYRAKGIIEDQEVFLLWRSFFSSFAMLEWSRPPEESISPTSVRSVGIPFTVTLKKTFSSGLRGGLGRFWLMFCCVLLLRDPDPSATL